MKLMKSIIILLIILNIFLSISNAKQPAQIEIDKLVDAVWKEPAQSIDITLYMTIIEPPKSEEQIRKMFEDFFYKAERPKENLSASQQEQLNRDIQLNVERTIKEQENGKKIKERIRIEGYRQRIDEVTERPQMVLLKGTPYEQKRAELTIGPNTPYSAEITEYKITGELKRKEIYEVEKVDLNPVLTNDIFEFAPPEDYKVMEKEPNGVVKVIRGKGGIEEAMLMIQKAKKTGDIITIKELLNHEKWQIRLRSLQVLENLLAQDKQGLQDAADLVKNDEEPKVRENAKRILDNLKMKK